MDNYDGLCSWEAYEELVETWLEEAEEAAHETEYAVIDFAPCVAGVTFCAHCGGAV